MTIEWTENIPTETGWYWMESNYLGDDIVEVIIRPGHSYLCIRDPSRCEHTKRDFIAICKLGAKWSTRIPEPNG